MNKIRINADVITGLVLIALAIFCEVRDLNKIIFGFGIAMVYKSIIRDVLNVALLKIRMTIKKPQV